MRNNSIFIVIILLLNSCVVSTIEEQEEEKYVKTVNFSFKNNVLAQEIEDFNDDTRIIVKFTGNYNTGTYQNFIYNGDTIGIFPNKGDQIPFVIEGLTTEAPTFSFQARGWDLRNSVTYYAYIPFNRQNYSDSINIRHINVSYVGQYLDSITSKTNSLLRCDFNNLSRYSYLYSLPTNADPSGNLMFSMQYLGGIIRLRIYMKSLPPGKTNYTDVKFIHTKLVADDPIYFAEGTYALDTIARDKEAADVAGVSYIPKLTPSSRGMVNVLPMKMDTVQPFIVLGSNYGFYYYINLPATEFKDHNAKLIVYDTDYNWYYADLNSLGTSQPSKTKSMVANLYYGGPGTPADIKISPWDEEDEVVNSNWNYK